MSDRKISNFSVLTGSGVDVDNDYVEILDASASVADRNKRIAVAELVARTSTFAPSGTGAVSRTVQAKLRDFISVKDFGAVGDGSTDDTSAIQAAITAVIGTGGWLFFPDGTYKITSALTIGSSSGWRITGASRSGAVIKQFTSNTGIFTLTACDTHSWLIADLTLTWNSAQDSSKTSSIAIYMSGATGTVSNGYYGFQIERVIFANGFRAINANETIQLPAWGFKVEDCKGESTMSGAFVRIIPNPSIGMPNIRLVNLYVKCDAMTESAVNILGANGYALKNLEFNNGTVGVGGISPCVLMTSCTDGDIGAVRFENQTITVNTGALLQLSGGSATFSGLEFATVIVSSAVTGYGLKLTSSASAAVSGSKASATLSGGGAFYTFAGQTFRRLENYSHSGATGSKDPSINCVYDDQLSFAVSADVGDAAATLAVYNTEHTKVWATALSTNRAVTLSTTGVMNGNGFRVVRTAASTGASSLNVGTGPLKALAVGQWCDVQYDGSAWTLMAFGSL